MEKEFIKKMNREIIKIYIKEIITILILILIRTKIFDMTRYNQTDFIFGAIYGIILKEYSEKIKYIKIVKEYNEQLKKENK